MIDREALLKDCQGLVKRLEDDLRRRTEEEPEVRAQVEAEFERAKEGKRTGFAYEVWRDDLVTQAAVSWVLTSVFVRFLEDNRLIQPARISGPGRLRDEASDSRTLYFRQNPTHGDRDYLLALFDELAKLPGCRDLFDDRHNALHELHVSVDGARELMQFWSGTQALDPKTGDVTHDFTDPEWDTRFLGDLYQDLSEAARKRYALLQTPDFVESFILDRTLEPAIEEFGLETVRMIDPTCGSGHFLISGFQRIFEKWNAREPATPAKELVSRALGAVYGIDLNPFAVGVARFRLLLAALRACEIERLERAPDFHLNLVNGDSLLFGPRGRQQLLEGLDTGGIRTYYQTEDEAELDRIASQRYHTVVGNPPYIRPKDPLLNELYRSRFETCSGKYALSVPFLEAFFDFATSDEKSDVGAGYIGTITANSFMKRGFGKKLIEAWLPSRDLTAVVDTSGAYIPGHGTPTVILFGRRRQPLHKSVRAVLSIRGEPGAPVDPAQGLVWRSIVSLVDDPGSENEFVSTEDVPRDRLSAHPWSLRGGGASEVKLQIEGSHARLRDNVEAVGITCVTGEDSLFVLPDQSCARRLHP